MKAINNTAQSNQNPNLESARRDSLREDGPTQVNFSISPAESPAVASREKPAGKEETTEPPPCVIYPKRGKGNARSKPRKEHGLATKEDGFGSRLCEGKVLGTLRIRSTLRDPRTKGKNIGC